jgi:uncharacterized protein YbjQ (UPF0145 family)
MVLVTLGVLTTTAQQIQGRPAREYLGIVSGDAVVALRRIHRRRRSRYVPLHRARSRALRGLAQNASERGATVVVGIEMSYAALGVGRILVSVTGTAIRL